MKSFPIESVTIVQPGNARRTLIEPSISEANFRMLFDTLGNENNATFLNVEEYGQIRIGFNNCLPRNCLFYGHEKHELEPVYLLGWRGIIGPR